MQQIGILTISDTRSAGTQTDTATPRLQKAVEALGWQVVYAALVPDDSTQIQNVLKDMADARKLSVVLTTGGTGFGMRDVTPEATRAVIDRDVPGLPEAMRAGTAGANPLAWLSRGVAGLRKQTLIINLPGSPKGAEECLQAIAPLIPHAITMIQGKSHGTAASHLAHS